MNSEVIKKLLASSSLNLIPSNNVSTSSDTTLQGITGPQGPQGAKGLTGDKGKLDNNKKKF